MCCLSLSPRSRVVGCLSLSPCSLLVCCRYPSLLALVGCWCECRFVLDDFIWWDVALVCVGLVLMELTSTLSCFAYLYPEEEDVDTIPEPDERSSALTAACTARACCRYTSLLLVHTFVAGTHLGVCSELNVYAWCIFGTQLKGAHAHTHTCLHNSCRHLPLVHVALMYVVCVYVCVCVCVCVCAARATGINLC